MSRGRPPPRRGWMNMQTDRTLRLMPFSVFLLVCSFSTVALGAGASEKPGLFTGDLGNILWTLITFFAVVVVLGKFAWKPILSALQKREAFIRDSLVEAKREREEAKRQHAEHTKQLNRAREEATAIVEEGRRDAEEVRKKILAEVKGETDAAAARAKKEIEMARDDAVKQLHDQTILLATSVAAKIIRKDLGSGDHKELIDEALSEMGGLN